MTYAEVAILRTDPVAHTPPTEESEVYLASAADAAKGFGVDKMKDKLFQLGWKVEDTSAKAIAARIQSDTALYGKLIKAERSVTRCRPLLS